MRGFLTAVCVTFIATSAALDRRESEMVKNTVAIQTGHDPRTASMTFHWRQGVDGRPADFFPRGEDHWYWPGHGIQLEEGALVIFLYSMVATPEEGLGFATRGYALAIVEDATASPESWKVRIVDAPSDPFDAVPATAVVRQGEYVVAVAIRQEGTHALRNSSSTTPAPSAPSTGTSAPGPSCTSPATASVRRPSACARLRVSPVPGVTLAPSTTRRSQRANARSSTPPRRIPSSPDRIPMISWSPTPRTASTSVTCSRRRGGETCIGHGWSSR